MRGSVRLVAGLLCLGAGLVTRACAADERGRPPAPPPPYQRLLQGENARKAEVLQQQLDADWAAGRFEEALRRAEALEALRRKLQGADHWQAADARWQAEAVRRILKQDAGTRRQVAEVPRWRREAAQNEVRGLYREAQPRREKALAVSRMALGDDHPATATC